MIVARAQGSWISTMSRADATGTPEASTAGLHFQAGSASRTKRPHSGGASEGKRRGAVILPVSSTAKPILTLAPEQAAGGGPAKGGSGSRRSGVVTGRRIGGGSGRGSAGARRREGAAGTDSAFGAAVGVACASGGSATDRSATAGVGAAAAGAEGVDRGEGVVREGSGSRSRPGPTRSVTTPRRTTSPTTAPASPRTPNLRGLLPRVEAGGSGVGAGSGTPTCPAGPRRVASEASAGAMTVSADCGDTEACGTRSRPLPAGFPARKSSKASPIARADFQRRAASRSSARMTIAANAGSTEGRTSTRGRGGLGEAEDDGPQRVGRLERVAARDDPVERDAEGVKVGPAVERLRLRLLGGDVGGRPHQKAGLGLDERPGRLRDAEVGEVRPAVRVEDDVLRLDVAVDDAAFVAVGEGVEERDSEARRLRLGEGAGVAKPHGERLPVDELHRVPDRPPPIRRSRRP